MRMLRNRSRGLAAVMVMLLAGFFLSGCAGWSRPKPVIAPKEKSRFEERVDRLIQSIVNKQEHTHAALSPVAVLPGSLKSADRYTRLEEIVMERLEQRLIKNNELITLSRQNWFAFREERPLDFFYTRGYTPSDMRHLVLYVVNIAADDVMEDLWVTITAYNSENRAIAGLSAAERFPFGPQRPARTLYESDPLRIPFPEGLEEAPYASIDRLGYSLAGELADAYRTGITAGGAVAADREINVLLHVNTRSGVNEGLAENIESALQQAVVANRGFTCAVSRSDFGPLFEQIDFYQSRPRAYNVEDPQFQAGTIFLMAEIFPHRTDESVGVALRAVWRVDPIEDASGAFIPEAAAGTYVSGFTAKSYLLASLPGSKASATADDSPREDISTEKEITASDAPLTTYTLCFQGFDAPVRREIYPAISGVPNLASLKRADDACATEGTSVGYILKSRSRPEALETWVRENLRTSGGRVVPFRIHTRSDEVLIFDYNGGFE